MGISLSGLVIDVAMAACAVTFVASLQIGMTKKVYTLFVFAVGILSGTASVDSNKRPTLVADVISTVV